MTKRITKKEELVDELADRTNFFKNNIREMVDALSDIIREQVLTAEIDNDSEMYLAPGITIGGKRVPDREVRNPRDGTYVMSPEKVIPYATFKQSFRNKLRKDKK